MSKDDVKCIADDFNLEIKSFGGRQYRLIDDAGNWILDIYFKMNKQKTKVIRNAIFIWSKDKWDEVENIKELTQLLKILCKN